MRGSPLNYLGAPILSLQSMLAVLSKAGGELPSVIPDGVYGGGAKAPAGAASSSRV